MISICSFIFTTVSVFLFAFSVRLRMWRQSKTTFIIITSFFILSCCSCVIDPVLYEHIQNVSLAALALFLYFRAALRPFMSHSGGITP